MVSGGSHSEMAAAVAAGKVGLMTGFGRSAAADTGKVVAGAAVAGGSHSEMAAAVAVGNFGETLVGTTAAVAAVAGAVVCAVAGAAASTVARAVAVAVAAAGGERLAAAAVAVVGAVASTVARAVGVAVAAAGGERLAAAAVAVVGAVAGTAASAVAVAAEVAAAGGERLVDTTAAAALAVAVAGAVVGSVVGTVARAVAVAVVVAVAGAGCGESHFEMAAGEAVAAAGWAQSRSAVAGSAAVVVAVGKAAKVAGKMVAHRSLEPMLSLQIPLNALPEIRLLLPQSIGPLPSSQRLPEGRRSGWGQAARKSGVDSEVQGSVPLALVVESLGAESQQSVSMDPEGNWQDRTTGITGRGNPGGSNPHGITEWPGGRVSKNRWLYPKYPLGKLTLCELENLQI